ncbi:MAG: DUF1015 domain-containing protein [Candidatus Omnitrophota bacterium]
MTEVKPFKAVIYNFNRSNSPRKVICPPYDIISPVQAKAFRRFSKYNMVHLTLPEAAAGGDRYREAGRLFRKWLQKRVLLKGSEPAMYFCQQEYRIDSQKYRRLGFIGRLRLGGNSSIYGHEHTRVEPKEDRFKLLLKVCANLEPIFVLFPDHGRSIQGIFKKYVLPEKPLIRFRDRENNAGAVWKLSSPGVLKKIEKIMAKKTLFIADGHHRYEVSLSYRDMIRRKSGRGLQGREDFDYIMAYFCSLQSPGLVIRPVFRLVKSIEAFPVEKFKRYFWLRKSSRREVFDLLRSGASKQRALGMYRGKNFYIFTLKKHRYLNKIDKEYRRLDICLLNCLVLKEILGIEPEDKERIIFSANARDLVSRADAEKSSAVFFLKPARIGDVVYLARAGKKLPAKTTYFYPKVPSGLVMYKFNEDTIRPSLRPSLRSGRP